MRTLDEAILTYLAEVETTFEYADGIRTKCHDAINLVLFGKKEDYRIKTSTWVDSGDTYNSEERKLLEATEKLAVKIIDNEGYEPLEATLKALYLMMPYRNF